MHLGDAPTPIASVSPATWGATVALLLLLGGLALFLMGCDIVFGLDRPPFQCEPGEVILEENGTKFCAKKEANYYACECQCTRGFSIGGRVAADGSAGVFDAPSGTRLTNVPSGSEGVITAGPVQTTEGGQLETWWFVDFDSQTDGWVLQRQHVAIGTDPLIVKPLDVCLPPALNANLPGGHDPTLAEVVNDCSVRVVQQFAALAGQELPAGSTCTCAAPADATQWDASCDAGCADPGGVCLLAGSDPPNPTPDQLSTSLFGSVSTCEVRSGEADIHVDGHVFRTPARGSIQIHGRPCAPGEACQVGLSYQLRFDDFSIPVRFHKDPKFVELSVSGASEPLALNLGPFGTAHVGSLPSATTLNSARGRRSGTAEHVVLVGRNSGPLDVFVDWQNKHCLIDGDFTGQIIGDDEQTTEIRLVITAGGTGSLSRLVNQPPRASAGPDQTLECTGPETAVTLSAAGSTDADGNIALNVWRRGSETGPHVGPPSNGPTLVTRQPRGETTYFLRVVDGRLSADTDSVKVAVVDTTPADIDCQAPAVISKHAGPVAFRAAAADSCGPASNVVIDAFACYKVHPNGEIKTNPSCKVAIQGDTLTIDKTGGVDLIRWWTRTTDAVGNGSQKTCEVRVDQ